MSALGPIIWTQMALLTGDAIEWTLTTTPGTYLLTSVRASLKAA